MSLPGLDCVVDASVGIKLCIQEPLSNVADGLFALVGASPPVDLYVPDLFYIECANILWKHVQRLGHPPDKAQRDLQQLCTLLLHRTPTADLAVEALTIALAHTLTAYDACYVALSQRLGLPLVTVDDSLVRKLAGTPYSTRRLADVVLPPAP